ncbi:UNVERIFIED_CONTAM: hypothetical protein Cloal_0380 [Acetivibrio alkalicellulosi]
MKKFIMSVSIIILISSIFATVFVLSKNMDNISDEKTQQSTHDAIEDYNVDYIVDEKPLELIDTNNDVKTEHEAFNTFDEDTNYDNLNDSDQTNKTDSQYTNDQTKLGEYVGQIDNNSIEIIVEKTPKSFRIEEVRTEFESLNLDTGDLVKVEYLVNEHNQNIILKIFK